MSLDSISVDISLFKELTTDKQISNIAIKSKKDQLFRSKGEALIGEFLQIHHIPFMTDVTFSDCIDIRQLRFDIIFEFNNRIFFVEVDGDQHVNPVELFGGEASHKKIVLHDQIKNDYVINKNWNLPVTLIRLCKVTNINCKAIKFLNVIINQIEPNYNRFYNYVRYKPKIEKRKLSKEQKRVIDPRIYCLSATHPFKESLTGGASKNTYTIRQMNETIVRLSDLDLLGINSLFISNQDSLCLGSINRDCQLQLTFKDSNLDLLGIDCPLISNGSEQCLDNCDLQGHLASNQSNDCGLQGQLILNQSNDCDLQGHLTLNQSNDCGLQGHLTLNQSNDCGLQGQLTLNQSNGCDLQGQLTLNQSDICINTSQSGYQIDESNLSLNNAEPDIQNSKQDDSQNHTDQQGSDEILNQYDIYRQVIQYYNFPPDLNMISRTLVFVTHLLDCIRSKGTNLLSSILSKKSYEDQLSSYFNGICLKYHRDTYGNVYKYADTAISLPLFGETHIEFRKLKRSNISIDLIPFGEVYASYLGYNTPLRHQVHQLSFHVFINYSNDNESIKKLIVIDTLTLITRVLKMPIDIFDILLCLSSEVIRGYNITLDTDIITHQLIDAGAMQIDISDIINGKNIHQILQRQRLNLFSNYRRGLVEQSSNVNLSSIPSIISFSNNPVFSAGESEDRFKSRLRSTLRTDPNSVTILLVHLTKNPQIVSSPVGKIHYDLLREVTNIDIDSSRLYPLEFFRNKTSLPLISTVIENLWNFLVKYGTWLSEPSVISINSTDNRFLHLKGELIDLLVSYRMLVDDYLTDGSHGELTWKTILNYFTLKEMCRTGCCSIHVESILDMQLLNQFRKTPATRSNLDRTLSSYFKPPFKYERRIVTFISSQF